MPELTLVIIVFLYLIVFLYSSQKRDFLNPVHVYVFSMAAGYVAYFLYYYKILGVPMLDKMVYAIYLLAVFLFLVGYFYFTPFLSASNRGNFNITNANIKNYRFFFVKLALIVGLIGFFVDLVQAFEYMRSGPGNYFFNLRYAATVQNKEYLGKYLFLFFQVGTVLTILFRNIWEIPNWKIVTLIIVWLFSSLFAMARTDLLLCLLASSCAWCYSYRISASNKINYKPIVVMMGIFIVGFLGFAIVTNKISGDLINTFFCYLGYPLIAFDQHVLGNSGIGMGRHIFYPISKLMSTVFSFSLGEEFHVPSNVFNTFSYIGGPYIDFGLYGVALTSFALGLIYRIIYFFIESGYFFIMAFYCFAIFPLAVSFYAYTFGYVLWIYFLTVLMVLWFGAVFTRGAMKKF